MDLKEEVSKSFEIWLENEKKVRPFPLFEGASNDNIVKAMKTFAMNAYVSGFIEAVEILKNNEPK